MKKITDYQRIIAGNHESEPELIPVNLIYDYPVRWSKFKVLRDLVQNFYDAVPNCEWNDRFISKIENNILLLTAKNTGFSYDWLIPIGASTKRDSEGSYAGYFGEGFKIASLCAIRDHNWHIEICSRNWKLTVVTTEISVDNRSLKSLAYHVWRTESLSPDTVMRLAPFSDTELLNSVLLSFYYPDNPLFGEKIWESPNAAVFFRSAKPKPVNYPCTFDDNGPGIIFACYQALGSFEYPLIFCLHNYRLSDRERNSFFRMDVVKVIEEIAAKLSPEASAAVLRVIKNRWYDRPKKEYDFETWYSIIRKLVKNVAASSRQKAIWQEEYPHLLVAKQVKRSNIPEYNRRRQALDWARTSGRRFRLVQESFLYLGYPTLEEACENDGGFSITREPQKKELQCIQIIEQIVSLLLPEMVFQIKLPPCKIIKNERSAWQGMTTCIPIKDSSLTFRGFPIRYHLPYIALKESLLHSGSFGDILSTYLHELAHMFGGDRSASFSRVLSEFMTIVLNQSHLLAVWEDKWNNINESKDSLTDRVIQKESNNNGRNRNFKNVS